MDALWRRAGGGTRPGARRGGDRTVRHRSSASQAPYRVGETFFNRNNQFKVAVGTTHGIEGQILVDRAHPSQSRIGPITVDISQLTSDSRHRDREIQTRWLDSAQYPTAVFTPTSIDGLPGA